jgi:hypothetical protein
VEYVRRAMGLVLDYTPETVPLLDHHLAQVPRDQPETIDLLAAATGAYFGEVARRALGGAWEGVAQGMSPREWRLRLSGDVLFSPVAVAVEAICRGEVEGYDGSFDVPPALRDEVEEALADRQVPEDEYYSLSGRLETFEYVVDTVMARRGATTS